MGDLSCALRDRIVEGRQAQDHGDTAAGSFLGHDRAAHSLRQAAGQGQAEPDAAAVVAVAEPLEW